MKLAIVADWLTVFGGAEHVLAEWAALWPDAPFFTTVMQQRKLGPLRDRDIRPTYLQPWYRLIGIHQLLLPWMPRAIESINLQGFDVILSSSHAVAKGIVPPSTATHVCYCHTPMRYAWEMEDEYLKDFRVPHFLHRFLKTRLRHLRRWDLTTSKRVDVFIANSSETQERIKRVYARDSIVLPPPVSNRFFTAPLQQQERKGFLALGRLVPYKRFDLLIECANKLKFPLKIAGTGSELHRMI
jgi:glycosyltransferase involved in cell wall biosynthesis